MRKSIISSIVALLCIASIAVSLGTPNCNNKRQIPDVPESNCGEQDEDLCENNGNDLFACAEMESAKYYEEFGRFDDCGTGAADDRCGPKGTPKTCTCKYECNVSPTGSCYQSIPVLEEDPENPGHMIPVCATQQENGNLGCTIGG